MQKYAKTLSDVCVQRSLNRRLIYLLKCFLSLAYKSMKIQLFITAIMFFSAQTLFAQNTFLLKNASKDYDVKIKIAKCEDEICEGAATVYLSKKSQAKVFQMLELENLYLELGADKKPTANLIELYGENNSGVIFDDYNFDGAPDLALRNGNNGAYGGPSYDVFLVVKPSGKFVKNAALTKLASENLGLFTVDKKSQTLETFNKSGCCWHETVRYQVINNRPKKIYVFTEDAAGADGEKVVLTTETFIKERWRTKTKTVLTKDYYKEN